MKLFGDCAVTVGAVPIALPSRSKIRSLLAYLAMHAGRTILRDRLIAEYWPEAEPTSARNGLKTALSAIRRSFRDAGADPDAFFVADRESVAVASDLEVDARCVELCPMTDDRARELAIARYAGEFLPGDHSAWAVERRAKLAARFEELLRAQLAVRPSAELAERIVARDPFYDAAHVFLIEDALARGKRKTAIAAFRRYAAALAELSLIPDAELARRIGEPDDDAGPIADAPFVGRSRELAEIRRWLDASDEPRTLVVSGIAGIGKSSLVAAALGSADRDDVLVYDAPSTPPAETPTHVRTIVCTRPEHLAAIRLRFPDARELIVAGLHFDEIAAAVARASTSGDAAVPSADAVWDASGGHPTLVAIVLAKAMRSQPETRHLEREASRPFEEQLASAGDDGIEIVQLLALDPELDDDDLAALLDWNLRRVDDAIARLIGDGILAGERKRRMTFDAFGTVTLKRLGKAASRELTARIAERLRAHEGPRSLRRQARHFASLGRRYEAAELSLRSGIAFATFGSSNNALAAFDAGIAELEDVATSREASLLLRELYVKRGEALNQFGQFAAAIRSFVSALDLTDSNGLDDARPRALAFVRAAHAYTHLGCNDEARVAVHQAVTSSGKVSAPDIEFDAAEIETILLFRAGEYESAVAYATVAYEKATAAAHYVCATRLAARISQASLRLLHFDAAITWAENQFNAAALASADLKAQAYLARSLTAYVVARYDAALAYAEEALRLVESVRRRKLTSAFPLGFLEWYCHYSRGIILKKIDRCDDALRDSQWLLTSPWTRNTFDCMIMAFATVTDTAILSGRRDEREVARRFAQSMPLVSEHERYYFLYRLAQARIAAIFEKPHVARPILLDAFRAIVDAEPLNLEQIHSCYEDLANAARGIDERLTTEAETAADRNRKRLQAAAGALWQATHG